MGLLLRQPLAVIEIVSPGNKDGKPAFREFVKKSIDLISRGIHLLIVDLFPPAPHDLFNIHNAVWSELEGQGFALPPGKDRILASYEVGAHQTAYVEPIAVGDTLPDMPLFLAEGRYVNLPLEATYLRTWKATPKAMRVAVETGCLPGDIS